MLRRQLSPAAQWHRTPVCLFCAARSQTRLKNTRAAPTKSKPVALRKITLKRKGKSSDSQEETVKAEDGSKSLIEALLGDKRARRQKQDEERESIPISEMFPDDLNFEEIKVGKPPVPMLSYGLDRVLFNPGVYRLQDPRSRVYNFDPYLEKIMPANEFDFEALSEYKTSSKDETLLALTKQVGTKFTGSTSSMSSMLQHFHYVLSNFRKLNHGMLSRQFPDPTPRFSRITLGPSAVFLRYRDGIYALDADKSYDSPNIMSWLGHSLEKLLTTERSEFEKFRRSNPEKAAVEKEAGRCYHYSKQGNLLMRSQLDAIDPRLPGTGVFDLKTRAVISIRMNHKEYEEGAGYQLRHNLGEWESFEREFYDMTRATMLKYSLQARMGRMDGIFIAYHNIERIFGFQYLSLSDMDAVLHGQHDTVLGDQEFKLSLGLVDEILTKATAAFPETSIRLHFEAREGKTPFMYVFAEPVTEEQADEIQNAGEAAQQEFARRVVGIGKDDPEAQAAWQEAQDDVDEQIGADQAPQEPTARESEPLTNIEESTDNVAEEAVEEQEEIAEPAEGEEASAEDTVQPASVPKGPLMGWTLTVRSQVNGGYVDRPEQLSEYDDWKLEYHLKEIPAETRWKLYSALKARRHELIGQDEEAIDKSLKHYRDVISRYTNRGRKWREEQDKLNDVKGVQVFRPLGPGSDADIVAPGHEAMKETEASDKTEISQEQAAEEPYSEESKPDELLSKEKKEEVLDGLPSVPS
ncbi:hypothetical protein J4E86_010466 [Alternaria arbusti]|uniref:uncharacterized protein n=1 Tax=Alternaria arbusti TaxID=232088 RepID=UPI002220043F|nr:uncharacterized protein J4E86_010466 [Alternaria arbusti]KAI4941433.1 hypothetical protein J4E86_010466 [Alternaria arbusti]